MPSIYAHYRFGCELFSSLDENQQSILNEYRTLFDVGLQGPDVLFFYKPVFHNKINRLGYNIHEWKGRKFFGPAVKCIRNMENGTELKNAAFAYLCGSACHYALDAFCHPYVNDSVEVYDLSHESIEGAFERYLLVKDHLPLDYIITTSLKASREECDVIGRFYGKVKGSQVYKAQKMMVFCSDGLRMKDGPIRRLIFFILRLIGKYDSVSGMVITKGADPRYAQTDQTMMNLYEKSLPYAKALIDELAQVIENGESLGTNFDLTYMG